MQVSVEIQNLETIRALFKTAPERMSAQASIAVQKTILKIESNAKREAPVNKQSGGGQLRQSIRSSMLGITTGQVEVGVPYARYVQTDDGQGTRPHLIQVRTKKVLANKRTGAVFGKVVKHPGTADNPFLTRGVEASQGDIDGYFQDAVNNVFK